MHHSPVPFIQPIHQSKYNKGKLSKINNSLKFAKSQKT